MTKAEKIDMLEAQLKAARFELDIAKDTISNYKKKVERVVFVEQGDCGFDRLGFFANFTVRSRPAPYGAGVLDYEGLCKALVQFIAKWNEAAQEAMENQFKQQGAANVPRGNPVNPVNPV